MSWGLRKKTLKGIGGDVGWSINFQSVRSKKIFEPIERICGRFATCESVEGGCHATGLLVGPSLLEIKSIRSCLLKVSIDGTCPMSEGVSNAPFSLGGMSSDTSSKVLVSRKASNGKKLYGDIVKNSK